MRLSKLMLKLGLDRMANTTGKKFGGRKKGSQNKTTIIAHDVKRMFFEALDNVGGVKYLTNLARTQPKVFVPALVRLLPTELSGPNGGPIQTQQMQDLSKLSDEDLRKIELILAKAAQP